MLLDSALDAVIVVTIVYYAFMTPFTKVEESFNMQAIHDIIVYGVSDLSQYDHLQFPGVVPRSFFGATLLAYATKAITYFFSPLQVKMYLQFWARQVLGAVNSAAIVYLKNSIKNIQPTNRIVTRLNEKGDTISKKVIDRDVTIKTQAISFFFALFMIVQFHINFYATRTLPNMLAFPFTTIAFAWVLNARYNQSLFLLSFIGIILRIELLPLAGCLFLSLLIFRKISFTKGAISGLAGFAGGLVVTMAIDSYFWKMPYNVPEISSIFFNIMFGKASDWGVEPWHFYFTKHLPNIVGNQLILGILPLGLMDDPTQNKLRALFLAALLYVGLYSGVPHKEWRFVVYVVPILSMVAANAGAFAFFRIRKALSYPLIVLVILASNVVTLGISTVKLSIAKFNYPGGVGLNNFNSYVGNQVYPKNTNLTLFMDTKVCMTGATRFLQTFDGTWDKEFELLNLNKKHLHVEYFKTDDKDELAERWYDLNFILTENINVENFAVEEDYEWKLVSAFQAYAGLRTANVNKVLSYLSEQKLSFFHIQASRLMEYGLVEYYNLMFQELIDIEPSIFLFEKRRIKYNPSKSE